MLPLHFLKAVYSLRLYLRVTLYFIYHYATPTDGQPSPSNHATTATVFKRILEIN